ncbi:MAG: nitroreductase [Nitrososphaerota archaeon]|jgi:nitroreductase|nr:nitroreductase [Nitrososphaerota archaeon]
MSLKDVISKRKSIRKYHSTCIDEQTLNNIQNFFLNVKPLYPDIKVNFDIVGKEHLKFTFSLKSPHYIVAYSENKPGYLVNVGFMLQQVDLYLSSIGLGGCWFGMAQPAEKSVNGLEFVIAFAFGNPAESLYRESVDFKRKSLDKISDVADSRLEVVRLAPSAMNMQNYYFVTEDNTMHVYCKKPGMLTIKRLAKMYEIDIGIALAHLYVVNSEHFRFFEATNPKEVSGHYYVGSVEI